MMDSLEKAFVVYVGDILDRMESLRNITPAQRHVIELSAKEYLDKYYLGGHSAVVAASTAVYYGIRKNADYLKLSRGVGTIEDIVLTVKEAIPNKKISETSLSKSYSKNAKHLVEQNAMNADLAIF